MPMGRGSWTRPATIRRDACGSQVGCADVPGAGTQAGVGELPAERMEETPSWEVRGGHGCPRVRSWKAGRGVTDAQR